MAWRGVHITQPARLSLADNQILVAREDGEVRLPIEDVAWLVIDTPQVSLSTALISACMDAGMVIVLTDRTHTPSGMILPFHRHHRQAEAPPAQLDAGVAL
jgi:CRISPR-associated protein Cas1